MYIVHTWISVSPKKTVIFEIQLKKSVKNMCLSEALETGVIETCTCVFGFQGKPCLKFSWIICLIF